ncbi:MAG: hypothetical protein PHP54_01515 [Clostridia bacterium]|nr:hypothetical protein [Clostridia bacterium]
MKEKNNKGKVDLKYNLEIEREDKKDIAKKGYDFVPRDHHWTNTTEQKIKVEEIEEKTKNK